MRQPIGVVCLCSVVFLAACGQKNDIPVVAESPIDESGVQVTAQAVPASSGHATAVFWGDTHLHTSDSADAFAFGNRLGAEDALRFARGEEVISTRGLNAQLKRPLDFLVIADHAVGLGIGQEIYDANPALISDPQVKLWSDMLRAGGQEAQKATRQIISGHSAGTNPAVLSDPKLAGPIAMGVWQSRGEIIDRYNEPGRFSAFIGYEFTPAPGGDNLHRVVVFRDGSDKASSTLPYSSSISENPEDLWQALSAYEKRTGGQALAIPHNSNLSNGRMFAFTDFEGSPIDADYAKKRARWEPLVEITQIKGDSESHPFLSPNDEFANYGDTGWEEGNLTLDGLKTNDMLAGDYVREALKRGLLLEQLTGINPFKFGAIGSTDSHTSLATADSDNFFGKHTGVEPGAARATHSDALTGPKLRIGWNYLASGYAAVWAKENSREALFDAMLRKEVYATTGPRITLRFFGGWQFSDADIANLAAAGYAKGVPMGGDLPGPGSPPGSPGSTATTGASVGAPSFLVSALMDPEGANLDRAQIVKGWVDQNGDTQERVYDVAWSDNRVPGENGRLPAVGNTVDLAVPTWSNTIGAPELKAAWTDPEFDPQRSAFYYVRIIEIPTPRWPAYDAVRYGASIPKDAQLVTQERAYSSPIWYTPASE